MALDTLANVKTALAVTGTADDTLLTQLQTQAEAFISDYCGRNFNGGSFEEYHPGGAHLVFLANYPVQAISSIHVDVTRLFEPESVIPSSRYVVFPERGVVESLDGPFIPALPGWKVPSDAFPGAVRVAYSTATGAVPVVVQRVYQELISHWYRQAKTHAAMGQLNVIESPGTGGTTVYPWGQATGYKLPSAIQDLLDLLRVPAM
jgi:hypothetical protein